MKKLIVIVGPNGVGKSTTARTLVAECPKCAYVDLHMAGTVREKEMS